MEDMEQDGTQRIEATFSIKVKANLRFDSETLADFENDPHEWLNDVFGDALGRAVQDLKDAGFEIANTLDDVQYT